MSTQSIPPSTRAVRAIEEASIAPAPSPLKVVLRVASTVWSNGKARIGIIILGQMVGSYNLSAVVEAAPHGWLAGVAIVLVLIGALSKSAVVPRSTLGKPRWANCMPSAAFRPFTPLVRSA